jgi:hypothetical protein
MKKREKTMSEPPPSVPESEGPVPDFVEKELEKPFEIDLSDWPAIEPRADFADRVVRELARTRGLGVRPAKARDRKAAPKAASRAIPSAKKPSKERPSPYFELAQGLPAARRA